MSSEGEPANANSYRIALSADGRYVAFVSDADNLVPNDTNGNADIFRRDNRTGVTTRVSVDSSGVEANAFSDAPAISADGRFVAFSSAASNLVAGDTNSAADIFVHDVDTATTSRVSLDSAGQQGNSSGSWPTISADGRYVAFESYSNNLVAGDSNNKLDVFLHDRQTGATSRVSVDSSGNEGDEGSSEARISGDGRYVAFVSWASNLVPGDSNARLDVFLRDTMTGTTTRVSVDALGNQANNNSFNIGLSATGRFVAFSSLATGMVAEDTNNKVDVFIRDTVAATTSLVSRHSWASPSLTNNDSWFPSISADGRFVAFQSYASNMVEGDSNGVADVFIRDMAWGTTSRYSVDAFGAQAEGGASVEPVISADARYVAFDSQATNLVPGGAGSGAYFDVYMRAVPEITIAPLPAALPLPRGATTAVALNGKNFFPGMIVTGVQASNLVVVNETTLTFDVTVPANAALGPRDVILVLPGTGPGPGSGAGAVCTGCVTVVSSPGC